MHKAARYDNDDDDNGNDGKLREHDAAESNLVRAFEDAFARED